MVETGQESTDSVLEAVDTLVDAWCEQRKLVLLRYILRGYPLSSGLTDDWANLLESFENVRAFGRNDLTQEETTAVNKLIGSIGSIVRRD